MSSSLATPATDGSNQLSTATLGRNTPSNASMATTSVGLAASSDAQAQQCTDQHKISSIAVEREGQDPVSSSLPLPDDSKGLAGFLADYGSDSDT